MFKPGGYLIGLGPDGIVCEHDSFTCAHCSRVTVLQGRERAADVGGFCRCCTGLICGPCVDEGSCKTIEKRLQEMERRQDIRRSYGF